MAILTLPILFSAVALRSEIAVSKSRTSRSAIGMKFSPSAVGMTRRVVLSNSLSPTNSSSCLIARVMAG